MVLIDKQAAIDTILGEPPDLHYPSWYAEKIKELPAAQPERERGRWIKTGQSFVFPEKFRNYSCSECGYDVNKTKLNFCPNCGAYMRGEQNG